MDFSPGQSCYKFPLGQKSASVLLSLGFFWLLPVNRVLGQITSLNSLPQKCNCQQAMDKNKPCTGVIIADSPSQTQFSIPSLWWADEQFNQFKGKLIPNWCADIRKQFVYLRVNRNLWSRLDYLDAYQLINTFGTIVRDCRYIEDSSDSGSRQGNSNLTCFHQYGLSIVDQQHQPIAAYTCLSRDDHNPGTFCTITFESGFEEGFR